MARRLAFLIGNQSFGPSSGLDLLKGPHNDVAAMAKVLGDAARGGYQVTSFIDSRRDQILPALEEALNATEAGDMLLMFYAGHGRLDSAGRLCLATAETRAGALYSTSMPAAELRNLIANSRCDQVVMLLDCCYSGAVGKEFARGGVDDQLALMREAQGLHVLTASTGVETARELETEASGVVMGRFSRAITDGIANGAADCDRDGAVSLSDLRKYLREVIRGQTPQYWAHEAAGDPIIARAGPVETIEQKRARRLGAWYAEGLIPEDDYPALAAATIGQGDPKLVALTQRLLDNVHISAGALMAAWGGAIRPPEQIQPKEIHFCSPALPGDNAANVSKPDPTPAPSTLAARMRFTHSDWIGFGFALAVLSGWEMASGATNLVGVVFVAAILLYFVWAMVKLVRHFLEKLTT